MVKESNALLQDTQPRIFPRAGLPNPSPAYNQGKDNYKRYVSKRCSTDQLASEARGWAEAECWPMLSVSGMMNPLTCIYS